MSIGGSTAAAELAALALWARPAPPITPAERAERLARARALMAECDAGALLVQAGPSLRYFTGLSWGPSERPVAMLLLPTGTPILVCPRFEQGSVAAELAIEMDLRLWEEDEDPHRLVADALAGAGVTRLAVDPALSFQMAGRLGAAAPGVRLGDGAAVIDGCRMIKSPAELALMRQAKAMTLEVQRRAARILAPGITNIEVARFIDEAHRALGASGASFCIVQFGRATAFPHGLPGPQPLAEGDLVLIDTGCTIEGYHSDITRTYGFGEPGAEARAIWEVEKAAQAAAFAAVRPGVPCEAVDAAARAVLEAAGLGPAYRLPGLPHRTGHGIGLAIHEPAYLVRGDRTPLAPGMCFSNEPMIVVPERFGIRLEDHFHVTDHGAAWFTEPQPAIDRPFG
ncbi:M24 family metallopeptidase [Sphingomonas morindae]|uniref:Xaa-Pro peptidase family protein n=1 Tax=Sphingomonas morindae TaxID=1541170 RepID=A0ABY4X5R7_9SPHN|nr:Xaa-Pro peptidase family protein [Sphingomonas morindae]USI72228.1 Xaa-Pro peptidase family protein [Sphingomonas morindae]